MTTPPADLPTTTRALEPHNVRLAHQRVVIALFAIVAILTLILASLGNGPETPAIVGPISLLFAALSSGAMAAAWIIAALGFGAFTLKLFTQTPNWFHAITLGVATKLTLVHLLGMLGLLSGTTGQFVAIAITTLGIVLLCLALAQTFKSSPRVSRTPATSLLAAGGIAITLLAASNPPGIFWSSEYGGFDAISYHLQLPQEWAQPNAKLKPLDHNIYSYLPSYMEAAYLHIAALVGGSLVLKDGLGLIACQWLHALTSILAAITIAALARKLSLAALANANVDPARASKISKLAAGAAFAIVLSTPWVVVTGSLAYNEMVATLLAAGACLSAIDTDLRPSKRALLTGLLMGAACACKPTFLFLIGPLVGLLLFTSAPRTHFLTLLLLGTIGGIITLSPPLIRNTIASGNPIFPAATALFGQAHWTDEQIARFKAGHGPDGTLLHRLNLLIQPSAKSSNSANPNTDPDSDTPSQPRGLLHPQWAMLFPIALLAILGLLLTRSTHKIGAILLASILIALCWWVLGSHNQSRFLLPLIIQLALAIALLASTQLARNTLPAKAVAYLALIAIPLLTTSASTLLFFSQQRGEPNLLLTRGVSERTAELRMAALRKVDAQKRNDFFANAYPEAFANFNLKPGQKVYLLGDATPLFYTTGTVYHTVWDQSPLTTSIKTYPDDPGMWVRDLAQMGCHLLVINLSEISRYRATYGYDPTLTDERIFMLLNELGQPLIEWPTSGRAVFAIPQPPTPKS
jgi:hypothetical protein